MKTTRYVEDQVLRKRPYIQREWCAHVLASPIAREDQPDGRVRFWGLVPELSLQLGGQVQVLRVVTLADGEAVHNAFPDRGFRVSAGRGGSE